MRFDDTFEKVMQALEESGYKVNTLVIFMSNNGIAVPFEKCDNYHESNRNPIAITNRNEGIEILKQTPRQGATNTLDASKSYDPDGDQLIFKWWIQLVAGTYAKEIILTDTNTSAVKIEVPCDSDGKTFHVICEITDNGVPNLTSYRRIIFEPK